ncbi:MBL fold metallo-hydrolase [Labedella phragmitis]|uniref:MBL fold metallo-hydrolase n=1 Tax=Labedella phragmitis TaxID=2498849 RepID=A0A3S3YVU3_9MICO|nr:MBL fold metallo-hydrolase [Labedella phragmitis]RWZ46188.1 MBL fold metallo-hydrolase [Labedella phragmitis]
MNESIEIGKYTITALEDGESHLPASAYPGADFSVYPGLLKETGTHRIRIGAHLVRGPAGTSLIDAGAGPLSLPFPPELAIANGLTNPPRHLAEAGSLPNSLAAEGVAPEDITSIFVTHLHLDHVGWIMRDDEPFFPNAEVYYGAEDWELLVDGAPDDDPARLVMQAAAEAGILRTFAPGSAEVLPGVTATHVPGHTPGHRTIEIESEGERIIFVGDLVELPAQLADREIHFMTDHDREESGAARAALFARAESEGVVIAAAHLTNPTFGLITEDGAWADARAR